MTSHDPRAAVAEVLGQQARPPRPRTVSVPPPPREAHHAAPVARAEVAEREDDLPGHQRGNLRAITVHVPGRVRDLIDEVATATRQSKGQVVSEALRETWQGIAHDFALVDADDPFAPAVVRRRPRVDDPVLVTFYLPVPAARALAKLRDETTLSVSALVSEAVERHYGDRRQA